MLQENKYPIREYKETLHDCSQVKLVENKKYGLIYSVFNRSDVTKYTLPLLLQRVSKDVEVIIVNDGSTDDTLKWLKTQKGFTLINCEKNEGISKSQNKAIQLCEHRGYKYIIFHDNDVVMEPNWVEKLLPYLKDKVGIISPYLYVQDHFCSDVVKIHPNAFKSHFTPTVNMVKAEVFKDVGHWDEAFVGWGSTCVDFIMRVYLAGWRGYSTGSVGGIHFAHATVGVGVQKGWWNIEEISDHNRKAWTNKWPERIKDHRPFLKWTGDRIKEFYGKNWLEKK